jgi:23S rRNA (cytidine1920-2'-O)/16S rRNA (cytidine1409-2'-O)-methyltransferase
LWQVNLAKQRLDNLLVELNLCNSRTLAQRLIQAGEVTVNEQIIDKPGTEVDVAAQVKIKERSRFVSRGGEKLAKGLELFAISVNGRVCLDGGISTGGFTDCLLQAGAKLVYGIDVGYGQTDWGLRNNPQVILRERTNLRQLQPKDLYGDGDAIPDLAVVDVSFISLTKILPALWQLTQPPREAVLLVKPQFEVGKSRVGKKGVVRDPHDQADAIFQVWQAAEKLGWKYKGLTWSPITGPAGNIEYLLWLNMESEMPPTDLNAIQQVTKSAMTDLGNS